MFCKWLYKYGRRGKTVKYKRVLHEKRAKTAVVNSVWLTCTTFFFYKFYSTDFFSFQLKRQHQKRQTCFSIWKKSMVWFDDKRFQRQRTNGKKIDGEDLQVAMWCIPFSVKSYVSLSFTSIELKDARRPICTRIREKHEKSLSHFRIRFCYLFGSHIVFDRFWGSWCAHKIAINLPDSPLYGNSDKMWTEPNIHL